MPTDSQALVIRDIKYTRAQMRKFAPEVLKELDKTNRAAAKPIITAAKSKVPDNSLQLKNWALYGRYKWDSAEVKKGIKFKADKRKRGYRYSAILGFMNESAAGSIFELAGFQSDSPFVKEIEGRFGNAPRILWRVLDRQKLVQLRTEIAQNYKKAEDKFQRELNK